jgi:hypothetical protein
LAKEEPKNFLEARERFGPFLNKRKAAEHIYHEYNIERIPKKQLNLLLASALKRGRESLGKEFILEDYDDYPQLNYNALMVEIVVKELERRKSEDVVVSRNQEKEKFFKPYLLKLSKIPIYYREGPVIRMLYASMVYEMQQVLDISDRLRQLSKLRVTDLPEIALLNMQYREKMKRIKGHVSAVKVLSQELYQGKVPAELIRPSSSIITDYFSKMVG